MAIAGCSGDGTWDSDSGGISVSYSGGELPPNISTSPGTSGRRPLDFRRFGAQSPMARIAFFGDAAAFAAPALQRLAERHAIALVVRPARPAPSLPRRLARLVAVLLRLRGPDPLTSAIHALRLPVFTASSGRDPELLGALRRAEAELICIASFRFRVSEAVVRQASLGALNLHPSLLPRHRGPAPLFWTYHAGDRDTGVTVHHVTPELDSGPI